VIELEIVVDQIAQRGQNAAWFGPCVT